MESNSPVAEGHLPEVPNNNPEKQPSSSRPESPSPSLHKETHQPMNGDPPSHVEQEPSTDATAQEQEQEPPSEPQPQNTEGAFLDQLDDEDPEAAAWDLSNPSEAPLAEQGGQEEQQDQENQDPSHQGGEESAPAPPTSNAAKHSSTISFARTVSHEPSFNDDNDDDDDDADEVAWENQRNEADPFKFMPPNDRTNSFPPVPPVESLSDKYMHSPPPASSQAQDILQEMEHDASHHDSAAHPDPNDQPAQDETQSAPTAQADEAAFQQAVGGELVGTEEEAADARFEEGLPLIPPEDTEAMNGKPEVSHHASNDLFAEDDAAGDDDFFNQTQNGDQPTPEEEEFNRALQRKSTTMVLGEAMQSGEDLAGIDSGLSSPAGEEPSNPQSKVDGHGNQGPANGEIKIDTRTEDVDAKWAAAFGDDDDDFLLDSASATENKELDPNEIFGSDDEGFLEDTSEASPPQPVQPVMNTLPAANSSTPALNGRYTPTQQPQMPYNPYAPQQMMSQPPLPQHPSYIQPGQPSPITPTAAAFAPPPPKPESQKPQSFVAKSKGGYQSPYDLPMDVVKPKKRASMLQISRTTSNTPAGPPSGPPRSASMYSQPPPSGGSTASPSPPPGSGHAPPQSDSKPPQLKNKPSFFEDLPMTSKPRSSSRQSGLLSPPQQSPYGQEQGPPHGSLSGQLMPSPRLPSPGAPPQAQQGHPSLSPGISSLVPPEPVSPYAHLQANPTPPTATAPATNRYSPAPAQTSVPNGGVPPPAAASRYSPAPPAARSHSTGYAPTGAPPPPVLPHQPRTSSPLAHFEITNEKQQNKLASPVNFDPPPMARNSSSHYEPRLTRVPSLPPTQEVEEESPSVVSPPATFPSAVVGSPASSKYSPRQGSHTPPPYHPPTASTLSPPKRSTPNYTPQVQPMAHREVNFAPPPRPQTQSPSALREHDYSIRHADPIPRPSSVQSPTSPRMNAAHPARPVIRARGISQPLNLVAPTDGREADPLQRWKGAPLIQWGVGGVLVTSFTKDIPRYGMNQTMPMILRSPGEVKIKHIKDIQPLEERLAKFPGPLRGKGKKKEAVAWLTAGIESLERSLPNVSFQQHVSHDDKRTVERVLLWKLLRVFIENDGVMEGNPTVDKAVRDIISPGLSSDNPDVTTSISSGVDLTGMASSVTNMQADTIDASSIEQIRRHLLSGDREKAVWAAVDKRLWGHAMLIANASQSPDLYKQVSQEFIRKEVNFPGHNNEPLAALYSVLSTNFEECVDELVPVHARAGLQLMSTSATTSESKDSLTGLDKWRETLGMVLSNRSQGDVQALTSLGNLLSTYGRAEAAHICYIFARTHAIFGGLDDPNAHFVLVGADHRHQADQFAKDTESLLLSEVYEYGLSLSGGLSTIQGCPHLAAYKLQHAITLAEYGFKDKALQYCEAIANAMMSQTKRSPYYHFILESFVDDLTKRLKLAPKEGSSSWISKPSMDKVSSNMWSRFNKFVSGEDTETAGAAAAGENGGEVGPFARIPGGTPTISPSPSVTNFEVYGNGLGLNNAAPSGPVAATKAASRYAPIAPQTSGNPYDPNAGYTPAPRSSGELTRRSGELRRPSYGNPYTPETSSRPTTGYQPTAPQSVPYTPASQGSDPAHSQHTTSSHPGYSPYGAVQSSEPPAAQSAPELVANNSSASQGYQPPSYGYEPPALNTYEPPSTQTEQTSAGDAGAGGYEPPSYQPSTFEPPSFQPGPPDDDDDSASDSKPKKKKTIFDDDEDDIPALRQPQEKSKAEKDRENEEMFRKVAEEEGKTTLHPNGFYNFALQEHDADLHSPAKRAAEAEKPAKKGWGFGGWFGGGGAKKEENLGNGNKPIKAKLGEQSSFVYDPDLKRWINKKPGAENTPAKTATPPPPRAGPTSTPPPPSFTSASAPPPNLSRPPSTAPPPGAGLNKPASSESLAVPPMMARSASNQSGVSEPAGGRPPSAPPTRPPTSLSNASSIDDLLGAAGPRRPGAKKSRKSGRYVDVMAK